MLPRSPPSKDPPHSIMSCHLQAPPPGPSLDRQIVYADDLFLLNSSSSCWWRFTPVRSFYFFPADQLPLELYANAFTPDPFNWQHGEVQPPHVTCVPLRSFGAPVLRTHSATAEPCLDCTNRSSKLNPPINSITGRGHFYHPYHVSFRSTFVTHHPLIRTPTPTLSAGAFVSFTTHTNPRVTERKWKSMFSWYLSNRLVERGVEITNHKPIFPTKKNKPAGTSLLLDHVARTRQESELSKLTFSLQHLPLSATLILKSTKFKACREALHQQSCKLRESMVWDWEARLLQQPGVLRYWRIVCWSYRPADEFTKLRTTGYDSNWPKHEVICF